MESSIQYIVSYLNNIYNNWRLIVTQQLCALHKNTYTNAYFVLFCSVLVFGCVFAIYKAIKFKCILNLLGKKSEM